MPGMAFMSPTSVAYIIWKLSNYTISCPTIPCTMITVRLRMTV